MTEGQPRFPLLGIMLANSVFLSAAYLGLGVLVESVRRVYNPRWIDRLCLGLDALPARALELTGGMDALRKFYAVGRLNEFWLRIVFGTTTVGIIFGMALVVGLGMWAVRTAVHRARSG